MPHCPMNVGIDDGNTHFLHNRDMQKRGAVRRVNPATGESLVHRRAIDWS
jgi:hypothetical protein